MIRFSIITPTFNSARTISNTLDALLGQNYTSYEYIVVDGGSTDATLELVNSKCAEFEARGIEVTIVSEKDNGIYDGMNKGIRLAKGEIVGIINSDDWYEKDALQKVSDQYDEERFDLLYANLRIWKESADGQLCERMIKKARLRRPVVSRDWNHPTMFVRRELYDKYQYRCESLHDDWDLYLRIRNDGYKIVVLDEIIANFRLNGTSHEKGWKKSVQRGRERYRIYRRNGYSRWYLLECIAIELAKTFSA